MKFHLLRILLVSLLLAGCTAGGLSQAFPGQSLTLSYDDFGPETMAAPFLGPRGAHTAIIAHYGFNNITPSGPEDVRYVNVLQSLNYLRQQVRSLPATAANEPLRQRLRSTYARLYPLQLRRYNNALNGSFLQPFGGMDRRLMLPALPPPEI
ncbi:hypothetical protein [Prosthecobacter vanneervenii]|uniref:Lipoprotein n=1 Tax=Prosthecobacter vanneervenii TaxID=48466 RepID=A0A7W7YBQ6_9BACT|nr:hypothetical protein [Prosthecobacter vanneervenii]MBB5033271.1 hypothetical protein [Prosthecobacter vanneervenii]